MKKLPLYAFLTLIMGAVSCKKDEGGGTPAPAVKFMSLTAGSTWDYKLTNNPSTTPVVSNYTLTATSNDSAANGRTYKVFSNSSGPNEYYNITGSDYYTFRKLPATIVDTSIEVLYLKDNLGVNETWSQSFPFAVDFLGIPVTVTLTFTNKIAQKGITRTVNGITYSDVTEVQTTLSASGIPVAYTLTSDIHYYYAPKVGQIENSTKIDFTVTGISPTHFEQKTELQHANIL